MKIRRKHPVRVNHLGSDPIPQLVRRLALPAMLAQFVNVLYSIIDRMYIGTSGTLRSRAWESADRS